jgi:hypothetical protein
VVKIIKINKDLVCSSCIMYFVKKFAIIENRNLTRHKSDKGKVKMQCLKLNQFCTRIYVTMQGKYRAKAIGYEAVSIKLSCLGELISLLVQAVYSSCMKMSM